MNQVICNPGSRRYNYKLNYQSSNFKIIPHETIGFSCHCAKLFPVLIFVKKYKYFRVKRIVTIDFAKAHKLITILKS